MKNLFALIFLATLPLAAQTSYSTNFPLTENPICEPNASACIWINGGVTGANWNNIATVAHLAYGEQPNATGSELYADATAVLTGTWASNQTATATVSVPSTAQLMNSSEEVELRLNTTIANGSITGYEGNCSVDPQRQYLQIVRWNGALGQFTGIGSATTVCQNGDVLKFSRNGNILTLTQTRAGSTIATATATDSTYMAGSPGIGFYNQGGPALENLFGFSTFSATGLTSGTLGGGTGGSGGTATSVTVAWTAAVPGTDPAVSYDVYRNSVQIGNSTGTSYVDATVAAGATYTYCVTSVDAAGAQSTQACAAPVTISSPVQTTPNPPTGVTAVQN